MFVFTACEEGSEAIENSIPLEVLLEKAGYVLHEAARIPATGIDTTIICTNKEISGWQCSFWDTKGDHNTKTAGESETEKDGIIEAEWFSIYINGNSFRLQIQPNHVDCGRIIYLTFKIPNKTEERFTLVQDPTNCKWQ